MSASMMNNMNCNNFLEEPYGTKDTKSLWPVEFESVLPSHNCFAMQCILLRSIDTLPHLYINSYTVIVLYITNPHLASWWIFPPFSGCSPTNIHYWGRFIKVPIYVLQPRISTVELSKGLLSWLSIDSDRTLLNQSFEVVPRLWIAFLRGKTFRNFGGKLGGLDGNRRIPINHL